MQEAGIAKRRQQVLGVSEEYRARSDGRPNLDQFAVEDRNGGTVGKKPVRRVGDRARRGSGPV